MEIVFSVEVKNQSGRTFVFDGEWLRSGAWRSGHEGAIIAHGTKVIDLVSSQVHGVAGIFWFVDECDHEVYLSLALAKPPFGTARFVCFAGRPPSNLKAELSSAPKLVRMATTTPENNWCQWVCTELDPSLTRVELTVLADVCGCFSKEARGLLPLCLVFHSEVAGNLNSSVPPNTDASLRMGGHRKFKSAGIFSIPSASAMGRCPKDALDGFRCGLGTIATSIASGVGIAIKSPVAGARKEGLRGFLRGLDSSVGGLVFAMRGAACGVGQVGRGLANTPAALRARGDGRAWDLELEDWVDIHLADLEREVAADVSHDEDNRAVETVTVVDMELYNLLGVHPCVSVGDIRRAYYREARKCYPDSKDNADTSIDRFQMITNAYQILSDPVLRHSYDSEGQNNLPQQELVKVDTVTFFCLLFGSEQFKPWIGEFHIASLVSELATLVGDEDDCQLVPELVGEPDSKVRKCQHQREVLCACHLRDVLARWVDARDREGFINSMRLEAQVLAGAQFGPELLVTIGDMFKLRAGSYLASELIGRCSIAKRVVSLKHTRVLLKHRVDFYRSAVCSLRRVRKARAVTKHSKCANDTRGAGTFEHRRALQAATDEMRMCFLDAAWKAVVTDIDCTVKGVSHKLLLDKSVPWQIRFRRAHALKRLADVFVEIGEATMGGSTLKEMTYDSAKETIHDAMLRSAKPEDPQAH